MSEIKSSSESRILVDYLPKIIRLVERNFSNRLHAKVGAEDMADSILGSVIRMARQGKIQVEETDDFWRLLVTISLNKIRKKARYLNAKKRDAGREIDLSNEDLTLEQLAIDQSDPTEEDGATISDLLIRLHDALDEEGRVVLAGRVNGESNFDIATRIGKSTKTVTRIWNKIQDEIKRVAEQD